MRDLISISWGSGDMSLVLSRFFPTDLNRTRKIFKLLLNDDDWTYDRVSELLDYFKWRQRETEEKAKDLQTEANRQKAVVETVKATKPKRNSPEYEEYVKLRSDAIQADMTARATAREAAGLKRTWLLLSEMAGRPV